MVTEAELEALVHAEYWDKRYIEEQKTEQEGDHYEWFRDFAKLRSFFEKHLPPATSGIRILHVGCGKSTLTADLHNIGYTNQVSIDFSAVVIEEMRTKYASLQSTWLVMDIRDLKFETASTDVVIDKGTLDAMIHGSMWHPPADVRENISKYKHEIARIMKPESEWLYITYRQPHFMKPLLVFEEKWELKVEELVDPDSPGGFSYFAYLMRRK